MTVSTFFISKKAKTNHILPEVTLNDTSILESNVDHAFTLEEEAKDTISS